MAIDAEKAKAMVFEPLTVDVERGRLRFFASATGQTDPIYLDVEAARMAGHRDLPVPPTFFFGMQFEAAEPFGYLERLGVDLTTVLHGEQSFTYHRMAYAGDRLTLEDRIVDVYAKRNLDFLVRQSDITRGDALVAESRTVIVVRP